MLPNAKALASLDRISGLSYGPHKLHAVDICSVNYHIAPVHFFYNSDYWCAQDKQNFAMKTVIVRAGQTPSRCLNKMQQAAGLKAQLVGGACEVAELGAKRAIDQTSQLAAWS